MPETHLVYVADREADIVSLMNKAEELGCRADWLIRSWHNRAQEESEKLWNSVRKAPPVGRNRISTAPRQNKLRRKGDVEPDLKTPLEGLHAR